MKKSKLCFVLFIGIVMFFSMPVIGQAEDSGTVGFDVQAVLPENQIDRNNSYFDLRMQPGQQETIQILINNTSGQESSFDININQAYTNNQGFIDYSVKDIVPDSSLKYKIKDIVKYTKAVTIPAQKTAQVPIAITMPKEKFDGQILSGISVDKIIKKQKQSGISNAFGYILGLRFTETDAEVKRDMKLLKVKPAVSFGKNSVVAVLENPTMDAYGSLKYDADVVDKKTGKSIKKASFDKDMQMAPNSTFDFSIDWGGEEMVAGNYILNLNVSDARGNVWKFNKGFKVTTKDAKDLNDLTISNVNKQRLPIWIYVVLGILLAVIVLLIVWIVLSKRRKGKDKNHTYNDGEEQGVNHHEP